jgi:hypothetical protein
MSTASVTDAGHTESHSSRKHRRAAKPTLAVGLLSLAYVSMIGYGAQLARTQWPEDLLGRSNDPVKTMLGIFWFTSSVLAIILSHSLHSPSRQLIRIGGLMLIAISIFIWLSMGVNT